VKDKALNRMVFSAHFADGQRRTKNNIVSMAQVLFFDIDHTDRDFGAVADALDGLPWLVHTTFSHTEDDHCFRAVVVLSRAPTRLEWCTCRRRIIAELREHGMEVDTRTKDIARGYFMPCNNADVLFDAEAPLPDPKDFGEPTLEDRALAAGGSVQTEAAGRDGSGRRLKTGTNHDVYRIVLRMREELEVGATRGGRMDDASMAKQHAATLALMGLLKGTGWPEGETNEYEFLAAQALAVRAPGYDFTEFLSTWPAVAQSFAETNTHASTQYGPSRLIARIADNRKWRMNQLAEREAAVAASNESVARIAQSFWCVPTGGTR
jgi:hypothetical protein